MHNRNTSITMSCLCVIFLWFHLLSVFPTTHVNHFVWTRIFVIAITITNHHGSLYFWDHLSILALNSTKALILCSRYLSTRPHKYTTSHKANEETDPKKPCSGSASPESPINTVNSIIRITTNDIHVKCYLLVSVASRSIDDFVEYPDKSSSRKFCLIPIVENLCVKNALWSYFIILSRRSCLHLQHTTVSTFCRMTHFGLI